MKDESKIIREFDKLPYKSYKRRTPKHDPTDSYFYLAMHLANCMMGAHVLNSHIYPVRIQITATTLITISHGCSTDKSKIKDFLAHINVLRVLLY